MDHPVTSTRSGEGLENSLADTREPGRELVSSERVWSGPIFAVDADQVRLEPGQEPVARQVVVHHDAVAVVALREAETSSQADGAAEILMIRQYRHPVRACLWEIPAGLLDVAGEEPVAAAVRELAEETDYEAATWHTLAEFYASPGFTTEGARIFLAQDLSLLPEDRRTVRQIAVVVLAIHEDVGAALQLVVDARAGAGARHGRSDRHRVTHLGGPDRHPGAGVGGHA